jgi:hypothetical protein
MVHEKLLAIQAELKAPKGQYNNFGKYKYRSCEDIVEAVKPLALKHGCVLTLSDEIVLIGDRYYLKTTATLADNENNISVHSFAREEAEKKGMDSSQITGAASSYARKYALNGLFAIDDTKDADSTNKGDEEPEKTVKQTMPPYIHPVDKLKTLAAKKGITEAQLHEYSDKKYHKALVKLTNLEDAELTAYLNKLPDKE